MMSLICFGMLFLLLRRACRGQSFWVEWVTYSLASGIMCAVIGMGSPRIDAVPHAAYVGTVFVAACGLMLGPLCMLARRLWLANRRSAERSASAS